jgi:hypothetical protein
MRHTSLFRLHAPLLLSLVVPFALFACGGDDEAPPGIEPIAPRTIAVNETLTIELAVDNPGALPLRWAVSGPDLPGFDRVASIAGDARAAQFRWTPLVSHVGEHVLTFTASSSAGTARASTTVTVTPAADAAPVFLRPGAGATFDLTRDPCVNFDVEVRDDDSAMVTIGPRSILPMGATLDQTGPKTAVFAWCPAPDQIEASERWTIALQADDGDRPPTPLDFVAVLRAGARTDCPGTDPTIALVSPSDGARVTPAAGFDVRATASDAEGLRDAPLLYWSTTMPDDPARPDITLFAQVPFEADGDRFRARVPIGLAEGEERTVWLLASVTDNDDAAGTLCDRRAETTLVSVVAIGGAGGGALGLCVACTASIDCASGVCATGAGGGRCVAACSGPGAACPSGSTCGPVTRIEGTAATACGDVAAACSSLGICTDDAREEDDARTTATALTAPVTDGTICPGDSDWYRIAVGPSTRLDVTLDGFVHADGDLDLQLVSDTGAILASSAGVTNTESAGLCVAAAGTVYARVFGYDTAGAPRYALRAATMPGDCCVDDRFEPDDTRLAPRTAAPAFEGTVCPRDDDFLSVEVTGPSTLTATIVFDAAADLDLELYGPDGTVLASSRGVTDTESLTAAVSPGRHVLRVYGYMGATADYAGELMLVARTTCTSTLGCPAGTVCDGGVCEDATCTSPATCPSTFACPVAGPGSAPRDCAAPCTVNTDCRASEACKWFAEGRFCAARGAAANGAACTTYADCGGQRACLATTGGYCARAGCASNADCETGTFCARVGGVNACAVSCLASDSVCRTGYACRSVTDLGGTSQRLCVP